MQRRPKPPIHSLARSGRYRQTTNHGQVFFWFHVSETQKEFLSNRAELSRAGSSERAAGGTRALEWTGMWVGSPGRPGDQSINSTERMGAGSRDRWGSSTPGVSKLQLSLSNSMVAVLQTTWHRHRPCRAHLYSSFAGPFSSLPLA